MKNNFKKIIQILNRTLQFETLCPNRQTPVTKKGFTLIEMIVSIFLFSVVMVVATGALVTILDANRKAQAEGSIMNNVNFTLESMTRSIRVGTAYRCPGVTNCQSTGSRRFEFLNADGELVTYVYNQAEKRIDRILDSRTLPVTAPEVQINNLRFYVSGTTPGDEQQPRVMIVIQGQSGANQRTRSTFNIETLVTQRLLDR